MRISAGAWQMKERGIEVAAVQVWREVKAQAAEVVEALAGQVRDWIGRAVDRLGPEQGLAYAGAADRDVCHENPNACWHHDFTLA